MTIQRISLYETKNRVVLVGTTGSHFRVAHIDRTIKDAVFVEDPGFVLIIVGKYYLI